MSSSPSASNCCPTARRPANGMTHRNRAGPFGSPSTQYRETPNSRMRLLRLAQSRVLGLVVFRSGTLSVGTSCERAERVVALSFLATCGSAPRGNTAAAGADPGASAHPAGFPPSGAALLSRMFPAGPSDSWPAGLGAVTSGADPLLASRPSARKDLISNCLRSSDCGATVPGFAVISCFGGSSAGGGDGGVSDGGVEAEALAWVLRSLGADASSTGVGTGAIG